MQAYNPNNIRIVANRLANKYNELSAPHVYWIAKQLNIYPDGIPYKTKKCVDASKAGKINKNNTEFVVNGRMNDKAIQAIESYLADEGYVVKADYKEEQEVTQASHANIWEQADLISLMKKDYEKAIADRDEAKSEAEQYLELADKYEKEIEELKDKLLISEKENSELKAEKKELGKTQVQNEDFSRGMENLQTRIGKYNQELNIYLSEMNILRKEFSALQVKVNQLQDTKKRLDGVMSDLIGCSKRLMNMK